MDLEDFAEPEVAIAVAAGAVLAAAAASPKVRRVMRQGAVYGLAGLLIAKDKVTAGARGAAHSARQAIASARGTAVAQPPAEAGTSPAAG